MKERRVFEDTPFFYDREKSLLDEETTNHCPGEPQ